MTSIHAMPRDDSIAPTLLLAMPQLRDPNFERSVVLLCEHNDTGAMGFVVNRPTEMRAADAVQLDPPLLTDSGLRLWTGGPVETHRGFLLLGQAPEVDESESITDGFHLTASLDVLRTLLETTPDPKAPPRCRLLLGYAGWGPGQLDAELTASSWLTAPADPDLVFGVEPEVMWEMAIRGLGVDPMALSQAPGLQ
jgi:putative transcriptional regulator